jgi:predicted lactoylglutathione lyase
MATKLPTPIPQIPVRDLERAISFYRSRLGFALDWKYEDGIAASHVKRHACFSIELPKVRYIRFESGLISLQCQRSMLSTAIGAKRVCLSQVDPSKSRGGYTSSSPRTATAILTGIL